MDHESYLELEGIMRDIKAERAKPQHLPFEFFKYITDNFSQDLELGRGGFGVVYKGVLKYEEIVVVKRLRAAPGTLDIQYENESHLLNLKHENIVRILGFCSEAREAVVKHEGRDCLAVRLERLICLEYMPNRSLDCHIKDASSGLNWDQRHKIIMGICCGLHFLHEENQTNTPIIHLDLKPANILLTDNMVPKITDFGLSRLFGEQQTRIYTKNNTGTRGYMAPEFVDRGKITKKSDIFSFGVIVLEMITGNRDYPWPWSNETTAQQNYVEIEVQKWRERMMEELSSTLVEKNCLQIKNCIEIGLKCLNTDETKRPTAKEIIESLNKSLNSWNAASSSRDIPTVEGLSRGLNESSFAIGNDGPSTSFYVPYHLTTQNYRDQGAGFAASADHEKSHPPMPDDEVYRLENIAINGKYHKRLEKENIRTVEHFSKALYKDEDNLARILQIKKKCKDWEKMVHHAQECCLQGKPELKSYRCEGRNVVLFFNYVHRLVGATFGGYYIASDMFDPAQKILVDKLKKNAYDQLDGLTGDHVMKDNIPVRICMDTDGGAGSSCTASSAPQQINSGHHIAEHQVGGTPASEVLRSCAPYDPNSIPDLNSTYNYQAGGIPAVEGLSRGLNKSSFAIGNDGPSTSFYAPYQLTANNYQDQGAGFAAQQQHFAAVVGVPVDTQAFLQHQADNNNWGSAGVHQGEMPDHDTWLGDDTFEASAHNYMAPMPQQFNNTGAASLLNDGTMGPSGNRNGRNAKETCPVTHHSDEPDISLTWLGLGLREVHDTLDPNSGHCKLKRLGSLRTTPSDDDTLCEDNQPAQAHLGHSLSSIGRALLDSPIYFRHNSFKDSD